MPAQLFCFTLHSLPSLQTRVCPHSSGLHQPAGHLHTGTPGSASPQGAQRSKTLADSSLGLPGLCIQPPLPKALGTPATPQIPAPAPLVGRQAGMLASRFCSAVHMLAASSASARSTQGGARMRPPTFYSRLPKTSTGPLTLHTSCCLHSTVTCGDWTCPLRRLLCLLGLSPTAGSKYEAIRAGDGDMVP